MRSHFLPSLSKRARLARDILARLGWFILSLAAFTLALMLLKDGARSLTPVIRGVFSVNSPLSALGFGSLFAALVLSGSPVAATALTLLDAQVLTPLETFAMIAGSRQGAAFIVLVIGFVYMLRGHQREGSLGAGLLSLLVTQTTYILVIPLGAWLLHLGMFSGMRFNPHGDLLSIVDLAFAPVSAALTGWLPQWGLFIIGFIVILVSFSLFDRALPSLHLEATEVGQINRLLYRPLVTFLLGALLTCLTMSVSLSLSLLVPLSVRGYIRQENAIPYIMGANITTFIDTLFAGALLGSQSAVAVVLIQMVSVAVVSVVILLLGYRSYERALGQLVRLISTKRRFLVGYLAISFGIPLALLLIF
jgi:solute carrier family 34 (sodium-dependent phosphate cotransporter)